MKLAVLAMPEQGHFQRLKPLIRGLAGRAQVTVLTHRAFQPWVEAAGATFVDLFERFPLEAADDASIPFPCRYVSFAGHYAEELADSLSETRLILSDTFSVAGPVVADLLGIPSVNVCAGHNRRPDLPFEAHKATPVKQPSPACYRAVEKLHRLGFPELTPFSYLTLKSPHLNIYCEPPEFLRPEERAPFEPLAFFGSLSLEERSAGPRQFGDGLRVYVSFGTVVWRYFKAQARQALEALSKAFAEVPEVEAIFSLGGAGIAPPGMRCRDYVDQWSILQEADVFVSHQGLNSTHEAIYHGVPMISYPFFADQLPLARRCRELGLAVPLTEEPLAPVGREDVLRALEATLRGEEMKRRLAEARRWELDVIAARETVLDRVLSLAAAAR